MEFFGTLPQWISSVGMITLLGIIFRFELGKRKLKIEGDDNIMTHYATEVASLRARIIEVDSHYRAIMMESDKAHEECKRDREALRAELSGLKMELAGLRRQMARYSTNKLTILEDDAPCTTDAVRRSKK